MKKGRSSLKKQRQLPLQDIRILDLTAFWSGPFAANLLANAGAEVIKIESTKRMDGWRGAATASFIGEMTYERSPLFNSVNTDKLAIALDLTTPMGADIFKKLVEISDVVIENYTVRVMKNFGLDYPVLREINPQIIMLSMPGFGCTGPLKEYPGFAYSIEQMAGIPQLTGSSEERPQMTDTGFADPVAGANGAISILMALMFRHKTGRGQHIDLSQVEALTSLVGDSIVEYTMNGRNRERLGNRHPFWAPQGYYQCKGDNQWVGITVMSDKDWVAFTRAIGSPDWATDEKFADSVGRWKHQDELDHKIEAWTKEYNHYEVMNILQSSGVAAGPVLSGLELLSDPHLKKRAFYQQIERKIVGTHSYPIPMASIRLSKCPLSIRRPAPLFGEHNEYVLNKLLGMSKEDIQTLIDKGIIGDAPIGGPVSRI